MTNCGFWEAIAEYSDGERIEKRFPYAENGRYSAKCVRQQELEEWLITRHEGCVYYTVNYCEE